MNAAAARALDCFSLRKCHETEMKPFQRCEDMPYLKGCAPDLPSLPDGISLPTLVHELPIQQTMPPLPPKRALNDWYLKYGKQLLEIGAIPRAEANFTPGKEFYSSWSNYKKGSNTRYTAVFTCPWTGERFASGGILGEEDKFSEVMNIFVTKPCPDESGLEARVCSQEDKEKYIGNWVGSVHKVNLIWYSKFSRFRFLYSFQFAVSQSSFSSPGLDTQHEKKRRRKQKMQQLLVQWTASFIVSESKGMARQIATVLRNLTHLKKRLQRGNSFQAQSIEYWTFTGVKILPILHMSNGG